MAAIASPRRSPLGNVVQLATHLDWWMILAASLLMVMGLMSLYSIDNVAGSVGSNHTDYFKKQQVRIGIGVVPFLLFLLVKPEFWRRCSMVLYAINIGLLALVLKAGDTRGGAQRWLQFGPIDFQPSELAKLLVTLTLATFLVNRKDDIKSFKTFALSFVHVAVPMALIYKQPHLGSTMVVAVVWFAVSLAAGVRLRFVFGAAALSVVALICAIQFQLLSPFQLERILGFLHPNSKSNGYQVQRGLVAIGTGGLTGKGFLKGEQKSLKFIPEQQTDFIFTVVGEEGGLVGGFAMLACFGLLFFRIWLLIFQASEPFHRMIAAGILAMLAFHMTANLGMVLQMLPVVGLWLPFMSFGGTAIWLCMADIALLLNVRSRVDASNF